MTSKEIYLKKLYDKFYKVPPVSFFLYTGDERIFALDFEKKLYKNVYMPNGYAHDSFYKWLNWNGDWNPRILYDKQYKPLAFSQVCDRMGISNAELAKILNS